jgi:ABC-type nitrate/sulfonate/bicarbonate transport system substrate-binding protein
VAQVPEVRGIYRSASHLPIWTVMADAGLYDQVGLRLQSFDFVDSSARAETMLFGGEADFISGNHISPYTQYALGKPIVHLTSPGNSVHERLATRRPVGSPAETRGLRFGETAQLSADGGYSHIRGNHILYLKRAGVEPSEVEWVELARSMSDGFRDKALQAMVEDRIDAVLVGGGEAGRYRDAGFHVLELEPLPMINGPTLTTTTATVARRPEVAERLVRAQVLAIHLARTRPEETDRLLRRAAARQPALSRATAERRARFPAKPYPAAAAVANAYELACLQWPETRRISPYSLWDLHFLRLLDDSGFIDGLYA